MTHTSSGLPHPGRDNNSLGASSISGLLSDNLRVTQLRAAASTQPVRRFVLGMETMLRIIITFLSLLLATLIIILGLRADYDTRIGDLLLNLGSEIVGIALTVAIVERLFERRQTRNEARKMSWRILLGIDHAVWVWQGGSREFRIEELLGLLLKVTDNDPLPDFTQNLLLNMGCSSQNTIKHEPDVVHASSNLESALMALIGLSRLRDQENLLPPTVIASHLFEATTHLAEELKIAPHIQASEEIAKIRNPAAEVQEWRHYGKVL